MQQITSPNVDNLSNVGYWSSKEEHKEDIYKNESHIHKQGPLAGLKVGAHKLTNDIFTYFPKGFKGSKNSDFYEYLSLGMFPYIVGSAMFIALRAAANNKYDIQGSIAADKMAKRVGAGVLLYGVFKWASQKLSRTLINASTGINLDWYCIQKVHEVPEPGYDKGVVRVEYPNVYGSVKFWRKDLMEKDGELNHNNLYYHTDKIMEKAGFKTQLNASNQSAGPKVKEVKSRSGALENIGKYIAAATGVAIGYQKAFENLKPSNILYTFKEAISQLWHGTNRNLFTKHFGKALILGSVVSTLLAWIIPAVKFKEKPDTIKSKVDTTKEFEVC